MVEARTVATAFPLVAQPMIAAVREPKASDGVRVQVLAEPALTTVPKEGQSQRRTQAVTPQIFSPGHACAQNSRRSPSLRPRPRCHVTPGSRGPL